MTVSRLPDNGSHLCTVALYRRGDGTIKTVLAAMLAFVLARVAIPKHQHRAASIKCENVYPMTVEITVNLNPEPEAVKPSYRAPQDPPHVPGYNPKG